MTVIEYYKSWAMLWVCVKNFKQLHWHCNLPLLCLQCNYLSTVMSLIWFIRCSTTWRHVNCEVRWWSKTNCAPLCDLNSDSARGHATFCSPLTRVQLAHQNVEFVLDEISGAQNEWAYTVPVYYLYSSGQYETFCNSLNCIYWFYVQKIQKASKYTSIFSGMCTCPVHFL